MHCVHISTRMAKRQVRTGACRSLRELRARSSVGLVLLLQRHCLLAMVLCVSLLASATTSEGKARSIASLPTDLLLRVRSHLQTSLLQQLAAEATTALAQYGAALVEGLCAGCLWWNADVYCNGVRAWVEAGYCSRIVEAHFKAQTHDDPLR